MERADVPRAGLGLRERKKLQTQAAILRHALRLFRERGYAETTVEQIAEAADVSKTTFFRYFPSKDDVVLHDAFDRPFLERLHAQPEGLGPIAALRGALREFLDVLPEGEAADDWQRLEVAVAVPELHARLLEQSAGTLAELMAAFADRAGRGPGDPEVAVFTGAVLGAMLAVWLRDASLPVRERLDRVDEALAGLERGLPLT